MGGHNAQQLAARLAGVCGGRGHASSQVSSSKRQLWVVTMPSSLPPALPLCAGGCEGSRQSIMCVTGRNGVSR